MIGYQRLMAVNETLILIAIVALGYIIWSMRRFLLSVRRAIHINTAEGTLMTRTLPNLAFAGLFFLVLNQTFLPGFTGHFGLDQFFNHDAPGAQQTLFGGKVLAERRPVVYPDFDGLQSMSHSFSEIEDKFGTPDEAAKE